MSLFGIIKIFIYSTFRNVWTKITHDNFSISSYTFNFFIFRAFTMTNSTFFKFGTSNRIIKRIPWVSSIFNFFTNSSRFFIYCFSNFNFCPSFSKTFLNFFLSSRIKCFSLIRYLLVTLETYALYYTTTKLIF